jgi:hypothetical protein
MITNVGIGHKKHKGDISMSSFGDLGAEVPKGSSGTKTSIIFDTWPLTNKTIFS